MHPLISKIRTVEERDRLLEELDILQKNLYEHKGSGLNSALKTQVRLWVSQEISNHLPENIEKVEGYFEDLKKILSKLKILTLKIAFEPTDSTIDKFINFTRQNVGEDIILDIQIDPEILGGAQITFKGEFRDFSLSRLFESEYDSKKDELLKIIKKET